MTRRQSQSLGEMSRYSAAYRRCLSFPLLVICIFPAASAAFALTIITLAPRAFTSSSLPLSQALRWELWIKVLVIGPVLETAMLALAVGVGRHCFDVGSDRSLAALASLVVVIFCSVHIVQNGIISGVAMPMAAAVVFMITGSMVFGPIISGLSYALLAHCFYNFCIVVGAWILPALPGPSPN